MLAYIDWHEVLPRTERLLRPGGRVGVLTSVTTSVPQFYQLFDRFRGSVEPVWKLYKHNRRDIPETWQMFRQLRETFAEPLHRRSRFRGRRCSALARAASSAPTPGRRPSASGSNPATRAVYWIRDSGYATHPALDHVGPTACGSSRTCSPPAWRPSARKRASRSTSSSVRRRRGSRDARALTLMLPFKLLFHPAFTVDLGAHVFPAQKYRLVHERLLATGRARPATS